MGDQKPDTINYKAWANNMISFIRERDLEVAFTDWCGGWPYPGTPTPPAALQAVVEAERGWQPISTAPKDGSILVFANFDASEPEYEIGRYDPRMWTSYEDAGNGLFRKVETPISEWTHDNPARATHWVRLSGSPALNRKEAGRG